MVWGANLTTTGIGKKHGTFYPVIRLDYQACSKQGWSLQDFDTTLKQCREGNAQAWENLIRAYQGRVFAVACYYLKNREEAVDAAQDSLVKVYSQLDSFDGKGEAFLPWILSITRNCCIDRLRKGKTRHRYEEQYRQIAPTSDDRGNPENQVRQNESASRLYEALEKLNPMNRDIVLLKEIQGLKLNDVARILGLPVGTIKSRSNRARVELGKYLSDLKGQG